MSFFFFCRLSRSIPVSYWGKDNAKIIYPSHYDTDVDASITFLYREKKLRVITNDRGQVKKLLHTIDDTKATEEFFCTRPSFMTNYLQFVISTSNQGITLLMDKSLTISTVVKFTKEIDMEREKHNRFTMSINSNGAGCKMYLICVYAVYNKSHIKCYNDL